MAANSQWRRVMTSGVSLAELSAANIQLRPAEAVSVVAELCRQHTHDEIPGLPSPGIIHITRDGEVLARGPMPKEEPSVSRAGQLLNDLLPGDAPAEYRASGRLRLVIARALGTLDLPPYASLDEFCAALARFSGPDPAATRRDVFRRWEEPQGTPAPTFAATLTISDIRRARRATGWSLDDLSDLADVPRARLRELEWGYVRNWRADTEARDRVRRYARTAGLDEEIVLSIAWPLIIENAAADAVNEEHQPAPVTALEPSGPQALARARVTTIDSPSRRRARPGWVSAAFAKASAARSALTIAVAALLALAAFAIAMGVDFRRPVPSSQLPISNSQLPVSNSQPLMSNSQGAAPARPLAAPVAERGPDSPPTAGPRPRLPAAALAKAGAAPRPRRADARPRSFFKRELFRIVIK